MDHWDEVQIRGGRVVSKVRFKFKVPLKLKVRQTQSCSERLQCTSSRGAPLLCSVLMMA